MRRILQGLALLALLVCLILPIAYFRGAIDAVTYETGFLLASVGWFLFAGIWYWGLREEDETPRASADV